uniref:SGNH hydrolase-type esterase domain-containing protein n=1 Tax=Tetradesmus obliquus TaxID=3088 RepID=A0A383VXF2_TETOB|eukprot:jgi/Sobl393_1/17650/SZX69533.1
MKHLVKATYLRLLLVLLLAWHLGGSIVAAATAHHWSAQHTNNWPGQAGTGKLLHLQDGLQAHRPARHLHQATPSANSLQQALQRMMAVPFATPRPVLALGYQGLEPDTLRNWHHLARTLATPGANVTIVTFGGSLTAEYIEYGEAWRSSLQGSWVEALLAWLKASFPGVSFNVVNASHGASDVIVASTCWYQYAPQDADLVLVEYSLNGCLDFGGIPLCSSTALLRVAHYESFYRRLLRRAPRAALMSVAAFAFAAETKVQGAASVTVPNAFRSTDQELHGMIARHYGAPMASIRDSLYGVIYNDAASQQLLGATRAALMADPWHPNAAGFRVWGDIVAYTVRQTLAAVMANGAAEPAALAAAAATAVEYGLPLPVSPVAAQQDTHTWCREGSSFQAVASCAGRLRGRCVWRTSDFNARCPHDNCRLRGYFMKGAGQALQISLDTSLDTSLLAAASNSTDGSNSASSTAAQFERRYLAVTYLQGSSMPASKMGAATLACIRSCRCKTVQMEWRVDTNTGIAATEVSLHPSCLVSITVAANTTTGGDEFAVTGVAVVPFSKAAQVSWIDAVDMAAVSAAGGQLPYSWP